MAGIAACIRKMKNTRCSVVVAAAGSSVRMGGDKLFMALDKLPVLAWDPARAAGFRLCDGDCGRDPERQDRGDGGALPVLLYR